MTYLIKYTLTVQFSISQETMGQLTTVLLFIELLPKKCKYLDQKVNQRKNTDSLEQQIYASSENFTPTMLVMLKTFRRSVPRLVYSRINGYEIRRQRTQFF